MINNVDVEQMANSPDKYFDHPNDVLFEAYLTNEEKIKVLESWLKYYQHRNGTFRKEIEETPNNPTVAISEALKKLTH